MSFAECFLSLLLCAFRKFFNTERALLKLLETCKIAMNDRGFAGSMDLSKAFDCLNHELPLAKLHAYGFNRTALKLTHSYLAKRRQSVKPEGSVLGPLFNIFINEMFLLTNGTELCNCETRMKNVLSQ